MSSVLLTWELGANLGHSVRLLQLATRLRDSGHSPIVAVRDVVTAASVLGPAGIPFIQGPCPAADASFRGRITSYADILLANGWRDPAMLWSYVTAWITLYRSVNPALVIHDASPGARLASWICRLPTLNIGNGYDIPPPSYPLPPFPPQGTDNREQTANSEQEVLANANAVIEYHKGQALAGLGDLLRNVSILVTFPELDHYGARPGEDYAGTLYRSGGESLPQDWPPARARHAFVYLRATQRTGDILTALRDSGLYATCFLPDIDERLLRHYQSPRIRWHREPVLFDSLYDKTHVCLSYAAEGTVASFLLHGIPQVLLPTNIEGRLTACRVQEMGAGLNLLSGEAGAGAIKSALAQVVDDENFSSSARQFAARHRGHDPNRTAERIAARAAKLMKYSAV